MKEPPTIGYQLIKIMTHKVKENDLDLYDIRMTMASWICADLDCCCFAAAGFGLILFISKINNDKQYSFPHDIIFLFPSFFIITLAVAELMCPRNGSSHDEHPF